MRYTLSAILAVSVVFFFHEPLSDALYMEGIASWYSVISPGIRDTTANMERFDEKGLTCAAWGVPFGTILEVTNRDNGRMVRVRVNDRGPAKRLYRRGRVVDLTVAAFSQIEDPRKGLARVRVKIVKNTSY